jgi:hypothetical protein
LISGRGTLEDVQVLGAGPFGALQFISSEVTLRGFGVQDAATYGLVAIATRLEASGGHLVRTRADEPALGDALHLRSGEARLRAVRVRGAAGLGLLAAERVQVRVEDLALTDCSGGGVLAEGGAQLRARGLALEGGEPPGVAVMRGASALLEVVSAPQVTSLLWADCPQGSRVELGFGLARGAYALGLPCVRVPPH